jgi:hypothetical protein
LFEQPTNLVRVEIQNIFNKIYGIVVTVIRGSPRVIDMPTCEEEESIRAGAEGEVIKLIKKACECTASPVFFCYLPL